MSKLGICTLSEIAEIGLGFKSLQNSFFYVDKATIEHFSIEKQFLRSIFTMKDLDVNSYFQPAESSQSVFYCRESEADLKGTGALKYIREMENRPAAKVKQSGTVQISIKDALEAQGAGNWYAPKAVLHESHIWLRKAFNTLFNPFIFESPVAVDQRCNFLKPKQGLKWDVLAAVLTSSVFSLSAESHGASSMGAGALELATKPLHDVKIIDIRGLDAGERSKLVELARQVWKEGEPNDWSAQQPPKAVQMLDAWLLTRCEKLELQPSVYADLIATCSSRVGVAKDKGKKTRRSTGADLMAVANGIVDNVRPFVESRQFPESFCAKGDKMTPFTLPPYVALEVHPMMQDSVLVMRTAQGKTLSEIQCPRPVADVIVRALMLGRRHFSVPESPECALHVLEGFGPWINDIQDRIEEGCRISAVGTKYEAEVRQTVFTKLGIDSKISTHDLSGDFKFNVEKS
jgi:hypothetical protein